MDTGRSLGRLRIRNPRDGNDGSTSQKMGTVAAGTALAK
jgi:hypothetical protein